MGKSKLMTPLFYGSKFNRNGRRMRAILEKEISDGTRTFRLWRSAGKPDLEYPRAENDKYILYVEINGYLAPLSMTAFRLINYCGTEPAAQKLYGGWEKREAWINAIKASGGRDAVSVAMAEEQNETERCGNDPTRQTEYIQNLLNGHVGVYQRAKENGGQSFPDFIGALVLNDLARCAELSLTYQAKQQAENESRRARAAEEEKVFCEEQNRVAEQAVSAALQIIRDGGVLQNTIIKFYDSKYRTRDYSIFNYLMQQYDIDVPLRTQGWINEKLVSATIEDGKCEHLKYYRKRKEMCSQKFFECMNALIRAVVASEPEQAT